MIILTYRWHVSRFNSRMKFSEDSPVPQRIPSAGALGRLNLAMPSPLRPEPRPRRALVLWALEGRLPAVAGREKSLPLGAVGKRLCAKKNRRREFVVCRVPGDLF